LLRHELIRQKRHLMSTDRRQCCRQKYHTVRYFTL